MARTVSQNTENRLLQTALQLFSKRGYAGTTTRAIATEAGMAEGSLFRYFPHKHDILMRLTCDFARILKTLLSDDTATEYETANGKVALEHLEKLLLEKILVPESNLLKYIQVILTEAQYDPAIQQFIENELFNGIVYRGKLMSEIIQQIETEYFGIQTNNRTERTIEILRLLALCQLAFFRRDTGVDGRSSQRQNDHWEV